MVGNTQDRTSRLHVCASSQEGAADCELWQRAPSCPVMDMGKIQWGKDQLQLAFGGQRKPQADMPIALAHYDAAAPARQCDFRTQTALPAVVS
jgi:hypothetical protein